MKSWRKILLPLTCLTVASLSIGAAEMSVPILCVTAEAGAQTLDNTGNERRQSFDNGWRFQQGDIEGAKVASYDDSKWRMVNVPHDWSIEQKFDLKSPAGHDGGLLNGGIGWYRKTFSLSEQMKGKKIQIDFDGVYMNSEVWINGHYLGKRPYGFSSFQYDMTPYLNYGNQSNVIAVKVNNEQPSCRWYSGSGIYRNVWIQVLNPVHVGQWGTTVTTPEIIKNKDKTYSARVNITSKLMNETAVPQTAKVIVAVLDNAGNVVAEKNMSQPLSANGMEYLVTNLRLDKAALWSVDSPVLYRLRCEVSIDGKVVDTTLTPFGVRSFHFDPNTGFYLNGKHMKLHGVCLHHDAGSLGAVWNERAATRQLQIMKDMGVNAIRTSHNPVAPEFLDLADRMGFVVVEEAFDCWETQKVAKDYHLYFKDWCERDIETMVERDRNHPSIILWSLGNEIPQPTSKTAERLMRSVHLQDATRPTTMANQGGNNKSWISDELGAVGYNYQEKAYDKDHIAHPLWCIYGSETASAVRTRGVYHFPPTENILTASDIQCSNYDNSVVSWGKSAEESWIADRDRPFVAGQFVWTGFDYIGEPTPYNDQAKSSYFGIVDTCGFPKDIYYFYKSQWSQTPTVHLLPDWNTGEGREVGKDVPVWAYTNAHDVELFLNGKSLGSRRYDPKGKVLHLEWQVPYQPGELKAIAKNEHGKIVATDIMRTSGEPAALLLKADRKEIAADGKDLVYVEADVLDKDGNIVPYADSQMEFTVDGGKILGVDNGNPISLEPYKGSKRRAFHGKCLLIVQAIEKNSKIMISAKSTDGMLRASNVIVTTK